MIRTLRAISAALHFVAPQFQPHDEASRHLRWLGLAHNVDPLTIVAVVERESGWDPAVTGKLGEVGLGQIGPWNYEECGERADPAQCAQRIQSLRDWKRNLTATAELMAAHRLYCKLSVGSSLAMYWMQGYQGYVGRCGHRKNKRGRWVAMPVPSGTLKVLARRRELARRFG